MLRLDDYLGQRSPKFVKINVDGSELDVLRGMTRLVARNRFIFHTEFGIDNMEPFGASPSDFHLFASENGYDVCDITGRKLKSNQDFLDSIRASGVYDYLWIPHGNSYAQSITRIVRAMWS